MLVPHSPTSTIALTTGTHYALFLPPSQTCPIHSPFLRSSNAYYVLPLETAAGGNELGWVGKWGRG